MSLKFLKVCEVKTVFWLCKKWGVKIVLCKLDIIISFVMIKLNRSVELWLNLNYNWIIWTCILKICLNYHHFSFIWIIISYLCILWFLFRCFDKWLLWIMRNFVKSQMYWCDCYQIIIIWCFVFLGVIYKVLDCCFLLCHMVLLGLFLFVTM